MTECAQILAKSPGHSCCCNINTPPRSSAERWFFLGLSLAPLLKLDEVVRGVAQLLEEYEYYFSNAAVQGMVVEKIPVFTVSLPSARCLISWSPPSHTPTLLTRNAFLPGPIHPAQRKNLGSKPVCIECKAPSCTNFFASPTWYVSMLLCFCVKSVCAFRVCLCVCLCLYVCLSLSVSVSVSVSVFVSVCASHLSQEFATLVTGSFCLRRLCLVFLSAALSSRRVSSGVFSLRYLVVSVQALLG